LATELAKAYVQIVPSASGMQGMLNKEMSNAGSTAGVAGGKALSGTLGKTLATVGKVGAAALGSATAAVAGLTKAAVEGYAEYEQLVGGVETLFGTGGANLKEYAASVGDSVKNVTKEFNSLKSAESAMLSNAANAYKTAGLSANDYMQTVTSFSASLISSVGGDTQRAAKLADQALIDMSDNANKMGTDMESIQNAYQGFAKANYSMLDNLKLGFGGSAREAARLINESGVLKGALIDLDDTQNLNTNIQAAGGYATLVKAIHAVQDEMGITGTTAREASTTIQGSMNQAKAAWSNLMVGVADDNADFDLLINNLVDSVVTASKNLAPRIEVALSGVGKLITGLAESLLPKILKRLPKFANSILPVVVDLLTTVVGGLAESLLPKILKRLPKFANSILPVVVDLLTTVVGGLVDVLPQLADAGADMLLTLVDGITSALPRLASAGLKIASKLLSSLSEALPRLLPMLTTVIRDVALALTDPKALNNITNAALTLIMELANGLIASLPVLIEALPVVIKNVCSFVVEALPQIIEASTELMMGLANALPDIITALVDALPLIIDAIVNTLTNPEFIVQVLNASAQLLFSVIEAVFNIRERMKEEAPKVIMALITGLLNGITNLYNTGIKIGDALRESLGGLVDEIKGVGKNIVEGLWDGISNNLGWIKDKFTSVKDTVVNGLKDVFDIHSPSKVMRDLIGAQIPAGIALGITENASSVDKALNGLGVSRKGTKLRMNSVINTRGAKQAYNFNIPVHIGDEKVDRVVAHADGRNAYRFGT